MKDISEIINQHNKDVEELLEKHAADRDKMIDRLVDDAMNKMRNVALLAVGFALIVYVTVEVLK